MGMSSYFQALTDKLLELAQYVPVELYTLIASFTEEIIAPIPSPIVMTVAGSLAAAQGKPAIYLLALACISAFSKSVGSMIIYVVGDKSEDWLTKKFGWLLGVSHDDITKLGTKFNRGYRDFIVIFFARAIPVVPTAAVSVMAGILRLNFKSYIVASFLGFIFRSLIYLYVGFVGIETYEAMMGGADNIESYLQLGIVLALGAVIAFLYYRRHKNSNLDNQ